MSGRQWKPGDVAAWDIDGQVEVIFYRVGGQDFDQPGWQTAQDGEGYPTDDQLRPLVVIDPEDADQVAQVCHILNSNPLTFSQVQEALRSLIAPPKPDEPQGLGAVVEDAEGRRWVRRGDDEALDRWASQIGRVFTSRDYNTIDAVRVLSEGVTP